MRGYLSMHSSNVWIWNRIYAGYIYILTVNLFLMLICWCFDYTSAYVLELSSIVYFFVYVF